MGRDWQSFFETWARPPSDTETSEAERTVEQVRGALAQWPALQHRDFRVYLKGSYRSRTNVRRGSDVDLAVELRSHAAGRIGSFTTRRAGAAVGLSDADLGLSDAPAEYEAARRSFKDDCLAALQHAFGWANVERHNKCIAVSKKSTTLPADVVPCSTLRRYYSVSVHHEGIRIVPDRGGEIINWPQQDYDNGVNKNTSTSRRYKRTVRGLKALKNLMASEGYVETPSWLVECLAYNVPDSVFSSPLDVNNALGALEKITVKVRPSELKYYYFLLSSELKRLGNEVSAGFDEIKSNEAMLAKSMLWIPNLPHESVPVVC